MFVIIALPEFSAARRIIDLDPIQIYLEYQRFERANNITQCGRVIDFLRLWYHIGTGLAPILYFSVHFRIAALQDTRKGSPYIVTNHKMRVIRHNNEFNQFNRRKPFW